MSSGIELIPKYAGLSIGINCILQFLLIIHEKTKVFLQ